MNDVMENVLAFIQELNELSCAAFIKKLVGTVRSLILQNHFQARIQKSNLLQTFRECIIIQPNAALKYSNVGFERDLRAGTVRIAQDF
ncbi:hypothetical protein D3C81_2166100 [compost metagenome]